VPTAKLTSKGQVTVPKQVRQALGVQKGDRLVFQIKANGRITLSGERPSPATALLGLLARYGKGHPVSVEEMHAAVAEQAAKRFRRSRGR
jgi:AbrB family looped-hinge helix DNA binding protein